MRVSVCVCVCRYIKKTCQDVYILNIITNMCYV